MTSTCLNVVKLVRLAAVALPCCIALADSTPASRPNIIVILADDMGFSDLGCYGSEIPTPHLDALAAGGLRFTQFYNTGRCCPTRAALLTGLYPHQTGVGHMVEDRQSPGYRGRLNNHCVTLAEVLNSAGYFTAMSGKWHVGHNHGVTPSTRGFRRSLSAPAGGFYYPRSQRAQLFLDGELLASDDPRLPRDWYSTDLWTVFARQFIADAQAQSQPFLLYIPYNAPHFPLQAPAEEIERFRGKYQAGWDQLSALRHAKQIELGIVDSQWQRSPRPSTIQSWDALDAEERDRFDYLMATYAACLHRMDVAIGELVAELKQRDLFDNTLILFMSDNGGNAESGPNGRTVGEPTRHDSNWFCGESWAYLQNTPFRQYKHFNHEGGIATPLIAHWPQGIDDRGALRHAPCHVVDIMATCVDVASAEYPSEFGGQAIEPMEGQSLLPAFANQPIEREALYWEHEGNAAVRVKEWKLVRQGRQGAWELYNMQTDRTEQHDLAAERPARVAELAGQWQAWAARAHVVPGPVNK